MSYSLKTIADSPLGYWQLNSTTPLDLTSSSNTPTYTNVTSSNLSSPPLVAGSTYATKILKNTSISISNSSNLYNCMSIDYFSKTFCFEFWFSFNDQFNGNGYYYNSSQSKSYYNNNILNILQIKNSSSDFAKIFYDYDKNSIKFSILGSGNKDAYFILDDLNVTYHIVAVYKNGSISLIVNGLNGISGYVLDSTYFPAYSSSLNFVIDGSSLNSANNFVLSDLAFYNYALSIQQIRSKMVWAMNTNKPLLSSSKINNAYQTFQSDNNENGYFYITSGYDFKYADVLENLFVDSKGLRPIKTNPLLFNNYSATSSLTYNSTYGASWSGNASLDLNNFKKLFLYPNFTFSVQVYSPSITNTQHIFSITNFASNQTIYLTSSSSSYQLKIFDPDYSLDTVLATLNGTASGYKDIGISYNDLTKTLYLYTSDAGATSVDFSNYPDSGFNLNSSISLGNSYHNYSSSVLSNSFYYKNFMLSNDYYSDMKTYGFSSIKNFQAPLTSNNVLNSRGFWIKNVPITSGKDYKVSAYNSAYVDSCKVNWTGMDSLSVDISLDNGYTWYPCEKNAQIPFYSYNSPPKDVLFRAIIDTKYQIDDFCQHLNDLSIKFYKTLNFPISNYFNMTPYSDGSGNHSFVPRANNYPIISRPRNFGIHFDKATGYVDGFAKISNSGSSVYGIEFFIRLNSIDTSTQTFILDAETGAGPQIYIETTSSNIRIRNGTTLYLNGVQIPDNSFSPIAKEIYHVVLDFGGAYTNNLYINGKTNAARHAHATYGFMRLLTSPIASSDPLNYYLYHIQPNTAVADDTIFGLSSPKVLASTTSDYAISYKIG